MCLGVFACVCMWVCVCMDVCVGVSMCVCACSFVCMCAWYVNSLRSAVSTAVICWQSHTNSIVIQVKTHQLCVSVSPAYTTARRHMARNLPGQRREKLTRKVQIKNKHRWKEWKHHSTTLTPPQPPCLQVERVCGKRFVYSSNEDPEKLLNNTLII